MGVQGFASRYSSRGVPHVIGQKMQVEVFQSESAVLSVRQVVIELGSVPADSLHSGIV